MYETRLYIKGGSDEEWRCEHTAENNIFFRNAKARIARWMKGCNLGEDRCGRIYEFGELVYEHGSM